MINAELTKAVQAVHELPSSYIKIISATPIPGGTVVVAELRYAGKGPGGCAKLETRVICFDECGLAHWSKEA